MLLIITAKLSILDNCGGPGYTSDLPESAYAGAHLAGGPGGPDPCPFSI